MTSLYALNYDCPIPWPAHPAYPASSLSSSSSSRLSRSKGKQREQQAPAQEEQLEQMQEVKASVYQEQQEQCECQRTAVSTLKMAYLHTLYTCKRINPENHFLHTLIDQNAPWSRHNADPISLEQLQDLLLDLDDLDTKWHTTYSDLLSTWEEPPQSAKADGEQTEEQTLPGQASSSTLGENARTDSTSLQDSVEDQILQDQIAGTDPQDRLFKQAYSTWRASLETSRNSTNGTSIHEHTKGKKKAKQVPKTSREWLSQLEVSEIKLQIILSLEILARLPTPSSRLGPNRPTSSSRNSWFTDLRNSQVASNTDGLEAASRKRKKADSDAVRIPNIQENGNHGDMMDASEISISKKALEKLYKKTAIRLDQLTDNLAIHQAVSGLGFSLDDLVMDSSLGNGISGSDDAAGGAQDGIQDFWSGTVEPEYSARLPSDVISGCHSKFFSASSSQSRSINNTQQEESPYHHPTPNLKALAKSVAAAQAADLAKKVPASPTLAKLLKANDEKQHINRRRGTDEQEEQEQEANWLMPPSATKAKSRYSVFSDKESQADESKRKLKRSQSLNVHQHQEATSHLGTSRSIFKSREVSFGQKKAANNNLAAAATGTAIASTATTLGGIRKTSAFMRTTSVPSLQTSVNISATSIPSINTTSSSSSAIAKPDSTTVPHNDIATHHKRKPASPKRLSTSLQRDKSRTLVLATPAKLHKHGKSRLSVQVTSTEISADIGNLAEEDADSPDEMVIIAPKRINNTLTRTLVSETPRTERVLAAETPGSSEIWVGETPGR